MQAEKRIADLSVIFKKMYEDHVTSKLSETRFLELSADYEAEQADLQSKLKQWQLELEEQEQRTNDVDRFIEICKKYVGLEELTPTALNELVNKVYVEAPDKSSGKRKQGIHISYNLLGFLPNIDVLGDEHSDKQATPSVA